jgi:hypothetical protein
MNYRMPQNHAERLQETIQRVLRLAGTKTGTAVIINHFSIASIQSVYYGHSNNYMNPILASSNHCRKCQSIILLTKIRIPQTKSKNGSRIMERDGIVILISTSDQPNSTPNTNQVLLRAGVKATIHDCTAT